MKKISPIEKIKAFSLKAFMKNHYGFFGVLIAMAVFRTVFFDWNSIPSGSMEPTLYDGDYVLINKTKLGPSIPFTQIRLGKWNSPKRGNVIVFYPPKKDVQYIKRVIGIPGDVITINRNNIQVNDITIPFTVDFEESKEGGALVGYSTIDKHKHQIKLSLNGLLPNISKKKVIPEGHYFVMGDHRTHSQDSRYFGLVNEDRIMGTTSQLLLSFSDRRSFFGSLFMPLDPK